MVTKCKIDFLCKILYLLEGIAYYISIIFQIDALTQILLWLFIIQILISFFGIIYLQLSIVITINKAKDINLLKELIPRSKFVKLVYYKYEELDLKNKRSIIYSLQRCFIFSMLLLAFLAFSGVFLAYLIEKFIV